jgi:hypothetical protein
LPFLLQEEAAVDSEVQVEGEAHEPDLVEVHLVGDDQEWVFCVQL